MTTFRARPTDSYSFFAQPYGHTVQNRAGIPGSRGARMRDVVTEKRRSGPRPNALATTLLLVLVLFGSILLADLGSVYANTATVNDLTAGISSLESSNSLLREELSMALNHPVLLRQAEDAEPVTRTVITLSVEP